MKLSLSRPTTPAQRRALSRVRGFLLPHADPRTIRRLVDAGLAFPTSSPWSAWLTDEGMRLARLEAAS